MISTCYAFSRANGEDGYKRTNAKLRSILFHPIGLTLVSILNDLTLPILPPGLENDAIKKELRKYIEDYQTIFASAAGSWDGQTESDLATKIYAMIVAQINEFKIAGFRVNANEKRSKDMLIVKTENPMAEEQDIRKPDFIISKEISSNQGKKQNSIVMMIDFGIGHEFWWKKQDQILQYVETLLMKRSSEPYTFDEPILLTIITVNKQINDTASTGNENDNEESNKSKSNVDNHTDYVSNGEPQIGCCNSDDNCVNTKAYDNQANNNRTSENDVEQMLDHIDGTTIDGKDIAERTMEVRFGTFICTRRRNGDDSYRDDYRIALLWRTETTFLGDASTQFGKVLCAAQMCAFLREQETAMELYAYFGPNCCLFDQYVSTLSLRSSNLLQTTKCSNGFPKLIIQLPLV